MKGKHGFFLIEMLVATFLLSFIGAGLTAGFLQNLQAERRIRQSERDYDPVSICFLRLEKDLRNAVRLRDYPFRGKAGRIEFPIYEEKGGIGRIYLVRYELKDRSFVRIREKLPRKLSQERLEHRVLLRHLESFEFGFSYLDQDQNLSFNYLWLDEPYYGIPRGVKANIRIHASGKVIQLTKTISVPQGEWGHLSTTGA